VSWLYLAVMAFVLAWWLCGCATYRLEFVDGADGSSVEVLDRVPWGMRRDLSAAAVAYSWTTDGGGEWSTGANTAGTDGVDAVQAVRAALDTLRAALDAMPIP